MKHQGEWRPVDGLSDWNLKSSAVVCRQLDCGSAVSTENSSSFTDQPGWRMTSHCVGSEPSLWECGTEESDNATLRLEVNCSDTVRLVNGTSLCSGRVEVKSDESWVSVDEGDFDQQDAEVVCRELGCGAPSVLQGALYGEVEIPIWTTEFQCEGNESVLLDCGTSNSTRNTSSPDKAVELTCSEPYDVRLVGETSNCTGMLEIKHQGEWRPVVGWSNWNLKSSAVVCRQLDCGSAVSTEISSGPTHQSGWRITPYCTGSESSLGECVIMETYSLTRTHWNAGTPSVICSDTVRLVNGTSLCSGRVEVKSNQSWVSVDEGDFDQQDAEVVCRELGCGAPSGLQVALYGEVETPIWTTEFQCEGNESVLLDCTISNSTRNSSSPNNAVGLTCSESDYVRLVGGTSNCIGRLEKKHQGEWTPVFGWSDWNLKSSAVVCRQLDCGSAVSTEIISGFKLQPVWWIKSSCVGSESSLKECVIIAEQQTSTGRLEVICSGLLFKPNITFSPSIDGVSEYQQQGLQVFEGSNVTISCSARPQYPGGSFHLAFTGSAATQNHTQPAVNHSASFLLSAVNHTHQGKYSCVYQLYVFSHDFSSESELFSLSVTVYHVTSNIIRVTVAVLLVLLLMLFIRVLYCTWKATTRGKKSADVENIEMDYYDIVGSGAEVGSNEEAGVQETEL